MNKILRLLKEQIQWIKDFPRWNQIGEFLIIHSDCILIIVVLMILWYLIG